jgi:hypothetical protein
MKETSTGAGQREANMRRKEVRNRARIEANRNAWFPYSPNPE